MKKILAVLSASIALSFAPAAFAQAPAAAPAAAAPSPAALAAARAMLDSMNYKAVMAGMVAQMRQSVPAGMRQGAAAAIQGDARLNAEQKTQALAKMEAELPKVVGMLDAIFNDPKLTDEMLDETAKVYARYFTADELDQMTAFNKTPVGAKMVATMPQLMGESMAMGQRVVAPRIQAVMQNLTKAQ